jgi:outer membrane autotransporter protein
MIRATVCKMAREMISRLVLLAVLGFGLAASFGARAECGGTTQCIAVGLTAADARVAHHGGAANPQPTMTFAAQQALTTSASQTVFVAAVTGPVGTVAALSPITITGANASEFQITGGTCSPVNGPVQDAATGGGTLCTITVAFRPTSAGAKTALLNVPLQFPGCVGCITGRTVNLSGTGTPSVVSPGVSNAAMTVPVNTPASLNLLPFTTGGATAISVPSVGAGAPSRGTVTVSGTTVTYTPVKDYFGPDTFSYSASNAAGASPFATVTVTVTGRPDPTQDMTVRSLLRAQTDTARRFMRSQISNIQRRMEGLHVGGGAGAGPGANHHGASNTGTAYAPAGDPFALAGAMTPMKQSLAGVPGNARGPLAYAGMDPLRPSQTEASMAPAEAMMPASFAIALAGAAAGGRLDLAAAERAGGLSSEGTGLWMGGGIGFGTRDASPAGNSQRFVTDGVTLGFDHRFTDGLVLGLGVGFARDRTGVGQDGSGNVAKGYSGTLYGSYQPARNWYLDGLLGYGALNQDSTRYVPVAADYARANRKGSQWFGSLAAGYEHREEGLLASPYGRLELGHTRLNQAVESGAGLNALTHDAQRLRTFNLAAGLRLETTHRTNFGWAMPNLRVEYKQHFDRDQNAIIGYADLPAGTRYGLPAFNATSNSILVGLGTDFLLADGLKIGFGYQTIRAFGGEQGHGLRLWVTKDLDAKGMPKGLAEFKLGGEPIQLEMGVLWDDNLNRARDDREKLGDRIYSLTASKRFIFPLTERTRATLTGFVSGDKAHTYSGYDRAGGGAQAEWQFRTSADFDAVTFGVNTRIVFEDYTSDIRSGKRYSLGVNARQSWTDRIDAFAAVTRNFRDARSIAFDGRDTAARFNLDYALGPRSSIYGGGEYRRGDLVTTAPVSLAYAALAKASVPDDVYGVTGLQAYRYDARTRIWSLGFNYALGARDSIDFSWRQAVSTPTTQITNPLYTSAGASYRANQFSLAYLLRF